MTISKTIPTAMPTIAPVVSPESEFEPFLAFEVLPNVSEEIDVDLDMAEDVLPVSSLASPVRVVVPVEDDELENFVLTNALAKVGSETSLLTDLARESITGTLRVFGEQDEISLKNFQRYLREKFWASLLLTKHLP